MNEIIFKRNHDRPQRIGYRNDVLFRATVHQGLKKRPRKKIYAGKLNEEDMYFFSMNINWNIGRLNVNNIMQRKMVQL